MLPNLIHYDFLQSLLESFIFWTKSRIRYHSIREPLGLFQTFPIGSCAPFQWAALTEHADICPELEETLFWFKPKCGKHRVCKKKGLKRIRMKGTNRIFLNVLNQQCTDMGPLRLCFLKRLLFKYNLRKNKNHSLSFHKYTRFCYMKLRNICHFHDTISVLNCKEIQPVLPKGNQPWIFTGRTDTETEAPILWIPAVQSRLIGKDHDAGKDWRQKEKEAAQDEMVRWHHWPNIGHESEQTLGDGEGQRRLACCRPWGYKETDTT